MRWHFLMRPHRADSFSHTCVLVPPGSHLTCTSRGAPTERCRHSYGRLHSLLMSEGLNTIGFHIKGYPNAVSLQYRQTCVTGIHSIGFPVVDELSRESVLGNALGPASISKMVVRTSGGRAFMGERVLRIIRTCDSASARVSSREAS